MYLRSWLGPAVAAVPIAFLAIACRDAKPVPDSDCAKYARTELRCFQDKTALRHMPSHGAFEAKYLVDAAAWCTVNKETPPDVGSSSALDADGKRFDVACGIEAVDCSDLARCELEVSIGVNARAHIARARTLLNHLDINPMEWCGDVESDRVSLAKSRRSEERTLSTETASACAAVISGSPMRLGKLRAAEDAIRIANAQRAKDPQMDFPYEIMQRCADAFTAVRNIVQPYRSEVSVAALIDRVTARCSEDAIKALSHAWVERQFSRSH